MGKKKRERSSEDRENSPPLKKRKKPDESLLIKLTSLLKEKHSLVAGETKFNFEIIFSVSHFQD